MLPPVVPVAMPIQYSHRRGVPKLLMLSVWFSVTGYPIPVLTACASSWSPDGATAQSRAHFLHGKQIISCCGNSPSIFLVSSVNLASSTSYRCSHLLSTRLCFSFIPGGSYCTGEGSRDRAFPNRPISCALLPELRDRGLLIAKLG